MILVRKKRTFSKCIFDTYKLPKFILRSYSKTKRPNVPENENEDQFHKKVSNLQGVTIEDCQM